MKNCDFIMNGFKTHVDLYILSSRSYELLIGMDWLEKHRFILSYYDKTFSYLYNKGNTIIVRGIPRKVTIREISSLQIKTSIRKGCNIFAIYIMDDRERNNQLKVEYIPILKEFKVLFLEEIP